jgi:energy-coupling factor transporter ATP-binding protein EcfA2
MTRAIEATHLTYAYAGYRPALQSLSFSANTGECVLVVGHNGAGKSTLLKLLNGILRPSRGELRLFGQSTERMSVAQLASVVAITFQNPADQLFARTVWKEIEYGPRNLGKRDTADLVEQALEALDLRTVAEEHPYDLPTATRKLVTVASALAMDTQILAFDEPTAGLSFPEKLLVRSALARLRQERTSIVVSHDLETFLPLATRLVVLRDGRIVFDGSPGESLQNERVLRQAGVRLPLVLRLRKALQLPALHPSHVTQRFSAQGDAHD